MNTATWRAEKPTGADALETNPVNVTPHRHVLSKGEHELITLVPRSCSHGVTRSEFVVVLGFAWV